MGKTSPSQVLSLPPLGDGPRATDPAASDPGIGHTTYSLEADSARALGDLLVSLVVPALFAALGNDRGGLVQSPLTPAKAPQELVVPAQVYTVKTLAAELGRTPRSVRGAIERGELEAAKSGRGYIISAEAVTRWSTPSLRVGPQQSRGQRPRRTNSAAGPMRRALASR